MDGGELIEVVVRREGVLQVAGAQASIQKAEVSWAIRSKNSMRRTSFRCSPASHSVSRWAPCPWQCRVYRSRFGSVLRAGRSSWRWCWGGWGGLAGWS
jgi:hypothetical protein